MRRRITLTPVLKAAIGRRTAALVAGLCLAGCGAADSAARSHAPDGSGSHTAGAAVTPRNPAAGSPERRAILDALRPAVEHRLGVRLVFADTYVAVQNGWAYVRALPYAHESARTQILPDLRTPDCDCDGFVYALLRRDANGWRLVESALGVAYAATPYKGWAAQHGAPATLFDRDADAVALEAAMREYINAFATRDVQRFLALLPRRTPVRWVNNLAGTIQGSGTSTYAEIAKDLATKDDWYHQLFDGWRDPETGEKTDDFYAESFQEKQGRAMWRRYSDTVFVDPWSFDSSPRNAEYVKWKKEGARWVVAEIGYPSA